MRADVTYFLSFSITFVLISPGFAALTPQNEPRDDSFYVCYERCRIQGNTFAPLGVYQKIQYLGCRIDLKPCRLIYVNRPKCTQISRVTHQKACPKNTASNNHRIARSCRKHIIPCQTVYIKKEKCPPMSLKQFGWFNNYPQALNAFYRCAYG